MLLIKENSKKLQYSFFLHDLAIEKEKVKETEGICSFILYNPHTKQSSSHLDAEKGGKGQEWVKEFSPPPPSWLLSLKRDRGSMASESVFTRRDRKRGDR